MDWYETLKDFQTFGVSLVALLAAVIAYRGAIRNAKVSADDNREQIKAADSRIERERRDKALAYALHLTADTIILQRKVSEILRRLEDIQDDPAGVVSGPSPTHRGHGVAPRANVDLQPPADLFRTLCGHRPNKSRGPKETFVRERYWNTNIAVLIALGSPRA